MIKYFLLVVFLFSSIHAEELSIGYLWQKEKYSWDLIHRKDKKIHGWVNYWILYDYENHTKEGRISEMKIKRYAQGRGLGSYLFSHAIKSIDAADIISKTRWYAAPLNKKDTDKNFTSLLKQLVTFYERLGGVKERKQGLVGTYLSLDHKNRKIINQRIRQAEEPPAGYSVREDMTAKEKLYAVRVYREFSSGSEKAVCEIQWAKKGRTKTITDVQLLHKNTAKKVIPKIVALIAEKLRFSADDVQEALEKGIETQRTLPNLETNLFFDENDDSSDDD